MPWGTADAETTNEMMIPKKDEAFILKKWNMKER
jgi:hypothetical protein